MGDSGSQTRRMKVVRLIDRYGLTSIGAEMEQRWTTDGEDRMSLRGLADYFNQQLLAEAMSDAGIQPLSGEVENIYRLLTDDDVGGADQTRTRRRLEREGVDVDNIKRDFVSYQAVRTYLKDHRGAEHTPDDRPRTDIEAENLQRISGRVVAVTENTLEQLVNGDNLTLGDFRVFVDINGLCEDCGTRYEINELLERGGCDCADQPSPSNE